MLMIKNYDLNITGLMYCIQYTNTSWYHTIPTILISKDQFGVNIIKILSSIITPNAVQGYMMYATLYRQVH